MHMSQSPWWALMYALSLVPSMQYHQWWRSQWHSRGLWWETPPTSPALSPEATPWAAIPTDGCTTTLSFFLVKLAVCWQSVFSQNLMLVSTAVRWPTLLDWVAVTLLPLILEASNGNIHTINNKCSVFQGILWHDLQKSGYTSYHLYQIVYLRLYACMLICRDVFTLQLQ